MKTFILFFYGKVGRMVAALRKLSEKDVKMADAMRSTGLL